jgi:Tfp pilus assembly protein PilF
MKFQTLALAIALGFTGGGVHAQSLPKPAEFYFDADPNAVRPIEAVRETGNAAVERLLKAIKRDPRAIEERAQLAHIAMNGGRPGLGRELYDAALAQLDSNNALRRAVLWNYGWDLYRTGAHADALAQWTTLATARATTPSWMPPTFALVFWQLGRRDEALQWYAAAVRSEPQQWRTIDQFATLLPDWRDEERATLAQVQQAWAQNPPSWP